MVGTRTFVALVAALAVAGCAGGSQGGGSAGSGSGGGPSVTLVVINQAQTTMSASVQWQGGRATRLGDLSGGATRTFEVPMRGDQVRVVFAGVGFSADEGQGGNYMTVAAGERLEWTLRGNGSVFYRRLPPA